MTGPITTVDMIRDYDWPTHDGRTNKNGPAYKAGTRLELSSYTADFLISKGVAKSVDQRILKTPEKRSVPSDMAVVAPPVNKVSVKLNAGYEAIAEMYNQPGMETIEVDKAIAEALIASGAATYPDGDTEPKRSITRHTNGRPMNATHPDMHRYSLVRAIDVLSKGEHLTGLEAEVDQELRRNQPRPDTAGGPGFRVPSEVLARNRQVRSVNTTSGGGSITVVKRGLADVLRNKLALGALGCTVYDGLVGGGFGLPVKQTASVPAWEPEATAGPNSAPTMPQVVTFSPHTVTATSQFTRRAKDVIPGLEDILINDLLTGIAHSIDTTAIAGAGGASGIPDLLGLINNPSIVPSPIAADSGNGGRLSRADLVNCEQLAASNNADSDPEARMGWLCSTALRARLLQTDEAGTAGSGKFLWRNDNTVIRHSAVATNSVPFIHKGSSTTTSVMIFGNWADSVLALWNDPFVQVNPYVFSSTGLYEITALQDCDFAVKRTASFSCLNGAETA